MKENYVLHLAANRNYRFAAFAAVVLVLGTIRSNAQLIDSYNPDDQSLGTLNTLTDRTGSENATEGNAQSSSPLKVSAAPTVADTNAVFNGHNYISFQAGSGLATAAPLYTGGNSRSIAAVYALPFGDNGDPNQVAGETSAAPGFASWVIQARDNPAHTSPSSPYIGTGGADVTTGQSLTTQLVFTVATYDATTQTQTLSYAFGLTGTPTTVTVTGFALNTQGSNFALGYNINQPSFGDLDLGQVLVYNAGLSSSAADAEIAALQEFYAGPVPEPSTLAFMGTAALGLGFLIRRRRLLL